jgi:hypothetical protein
MICRKSADRETGTSRAEAAPLGRCAQAKAMFRASGDGRARTRVRIEAEVVPPTGRPETLFSRADPSNGNDLRSGSEAAGSPSRSQTEDNPAE